MTSMTPRPNASDPHCTSHYTENDEGFDPQVFHRDVVGALLARASACADEQRSAAPAGAEEERRDGQETDVPPGDVSQRDAAAAIEEWRSTRVHELEEVGASNFTHAVTSGTLAVALGYERLVRSVTAHLEARRSVLLVGPPQVGKTAIIAAVAQALYASRLKESEEAGRSRLVVSVTTSDLLADSNKLGEWEKNLGQVVAVARDTGCIVYVEDIWCLREAGRSRDYSSNFSGYLRPFVERGEIVLMGETTSENLTSRSTQKHPLMDDRSFMRHIEQVTVPEPGLEETRAIVAARGRLMEHTQALHIEEAALARAVDLPRRFLAQHAFPGKAIRLLQATVNQEAEPKPAPQPLDQHDAPRVAPAPAKAKGTAVPAVPVVTAEAVTTCFAEMTGLPLWLLSDAVPLTREALRERFEARIIGQPEAVEAVVDVITMIKAELHDPLRPLAVLLFVGPTGVGKTELATVLAEEVFGQRERLLRFDMSEYQNTFNAATLLEQLTERQRNQVFSVVLLDEFEKAAASIADLFLQVFDAGRLTDASGSTVDLRNAILILTTNLGSQEASKASAGLGFVRSAAEEADVARATQRAAYLDAVKAAFRPEFLNRLDQIVVFNALDRTTMLRIVQRELAMALRREGVVRRDLAPQCDDPVVDFLVTKGFTPAYGARPLQRAIKQYVLLPLAREIAARPHQCGIPMALQVRDGQIVVAADALDTSATQPAVTTTEPRLRRDGTHMLGLAG